MCGRSFCQRACRSGRILHARHMIWMWFGPSAWALLDVFYLYALSPWCLTNSLQFCSLCVDGIQCRVFGPKQHHTFSTAKSYFVCMECANKHKQDYNTNTDIWTRGGIIWYMHVTSRRSKQSRISIPLQQAGRKSSSDPEKVKPSDEINICEYSYAGRGIIVSKVHAGC